MRNAQMVQLSNHSPTTFLHIYVYLIYGQIEWIGCPVKIQIQICSSYSFNIYRYISRSIEYHLL